MSAERLPQITRIDFTDKERFLMIKVFDVAATFMLSLQGVPADTLDVDAVKFIQDRPGEVSHLLLKVNADKIGAKEVLDSFITDTIEVGIIKMRLRRMKQTLAEVAARNPQATAASSLRRDMEWVMLELEKRL